MEKVLYLWVLESPYNFYDQFQSLLVAAYTREEAERIDPTGILYDVSENADNSEYSWEGNWVENPKYLKSVKRVGIACEDIEPNTVIMKNYKAG